MIIVLKKCSICQKFKLCQVDHFLFYCCIQKKGLKKFQEEELPDYMEKLEKILIQYKEGNSFFVTDTVSHKITNRGLGLHGFLKYNTPCGNLNCMK